MDFMCKTTLHVLYTAILDSMSLQSDQNIEVEHIRIQRVKTVNKIKLDKG